LSQAESVIGFVASILESVVKLYSGISQNED
jgi:hypothetical protein